MGGSETTHRLSPPGRHNRRPDRGINYDRRRRAGRQTVLKTGWCSGHVPIGVTSGWPDVHRAESWASATMIPTDSVDELEEVLDDVDDTIRRIDAETQDTLSGETGDGSPVVGRALSYRSNGFRLVAAPDWSHLKLITSYDAAEELAVNRKISRTDGGVQVSGVQLEEHDVTSAREDLQDNAESDLEDIRQRLVQRIAGGDLYTSVSGTDTFVTGFELEKRLYSRDDLEAAALDRSFQELFNTAWAGQELLCYEYDLRYPATDSSGPRGYE